MMNTKERYRWAIGKIRKKIADAHNQISVLANCAAILKEDFPGVFWVGFYYVREDFLSLGPFQGPPACAKLGLEAGVCADAVKSETTIIVGNVHDYPGHVACDSRSNSEIVVPVFNTSGELKAVLDIDSANFNHFSAEDQNNLEKIADLLKPVWDL
jgi:L-methionine (R)-S-oxide reductase